METRDIRFDNLKGILIFLVVFGHCIEYIVNYTTNTVLLNYIYILMYTFNMATFSFISGYFSKSSTPNGIAKLTVTLVVFHLIGWSLFVRDISDILTPWWVLWYLLCLVIWKLVTPALNKIRFLLPLSTVIALVAGFTEASRFFAVSRILCFYPYFLIGFKTQNSTIDILIAKPKAWYTAAILVVFAGFSVMYFCGLELREPLLLTSSYAYQGYTNTTGLLLRSATMLSGFLCLFSLIALAPTKKSVLSTLGRNSFAVYILHPFILAFAFKIYDILTRQMQLSSVLSLTASIILSIVICFISANKTVSRAVSSFIGFFAKHLLPRSSD